MKNKTNLKSIFFQNLSILMETIEKTLTGY